jgi:hypothetical protein
MKKKLVSNNYIFACLIVVVFVYLFYHYNSTCNNRTQFSIEETKYEALFGENEKENNVENQIKDFKLFKHLYKTTSSSKEKSLYSKWPNSFNFDNNYIKILTELKDYFVKICLKEMKQELSIQTLVEMLKILKQSPDDQCQSVAENIEALFEINIKYNKLKLSKTLANKVKSWLKGDDMLLKQVYNQVILMESRKIIKTNFKRQL